MAGKTLFDKENSDNSNLTFGVDYQQAFYSTWEQPVNQSKKTGHDAVTSQAGPYIQEELQLHHLTLRAGGRFNFIRHEIDRLSGQAPISKNKSFQIIRRKYPHYQKSTIEPIKSTKQFK